jgi:PERQ amino acid-rich with GYF domain-containing protein
MSNTAHQRDSSASQPRTSTESAAPYVPPHVHANRNGATTEHRYNKDQLLDLFRAHQDAENIPPVALTDLLVGGWEPNITNGTSNTSWGRRDDHKDSHGAELCWDRDAHMFPMALHDMTEEERDVSLVAMRSVDIY